MNTILKSAYILIVITALLFIAPKAVNAISASSSASASSSGASATSESSASISSSASTASSSTAESSAQASATAASYATSPVRSKPKAVVTRIEEEVATSTTPNNDQAEAINCTEELKSANENIVTANQRLEDLKMQLDSIEDRQVKTLNLFLYSFVALGVIVILEIILLIRRR